MLSELNRMLEKNLFRESSNEELFNPYSTRSEGLDRADAISIRRDNLRKYVTERRKKPEVLLLAEAPGPWGCRFSGVPITSEEQLLDPDFPISGRQSSLEENPHKEYSATIYWGILLPWHEHIFTWNTVPMHPHYQGKPLTIRTPRASEIKRFLPLVSEMVEILKPRAVVAVGRKADKALGMIDVEATYVRHPSQGGATLFREGVLQILKELNLIT